MIILVVLECPIQFELVFSLGMVCHGMVYLDIVCTQILHTKHICKPCSGITGDSLAT
jgi:hypothetical protein